MLNFSKEQFIRDHAMLTFHGSIEQEARVQKQESGANLNYAFECLLEVKNGDLKTVVLSECVRTESRRLLFGLLAPGEKSGTMG